MMRKQTGIRFLVFAVLLVALTTTSFAKDHHKKRPFEKLSYPPLHKVNSPDIVHYTLPNGMKILMVEDHDFPKVEFRAMVKGGQMVEPESAKGLTDLFGEVQRTGGTVSMSGDDADDFLGSIGASIKSDMDDEYGVLSGETLTEYTNKVLPLFGDFLMKPNFEQEKVDLGKTHLNSGISRRNDSAMNIAMREFRKLVYGASSPFARQIEYADVEKLNRDELIAFHKKYYRPDSTILAVWGDFKTDDMKAELKKIFGAWKNEGPAPKIEIPFIFPPTPSLNFAEKADAAQSIVLMGHLGVKYDNPDYPAIMMMNDILGGGFNSRIFKKVRTEKGLAYGAGGGVYANFDHPGILFLYTATKPESTTEALKLVVDQAKLIREKEVKDDELALAKDGYLNKYPFQFDSIGKILRRVTLYDFYGYPENFNEKIREGVQKVTKADVLRVAKKYLHPDKLTMMVVGNSSKFAEPLSTIGKVNTVDISIPEPPSKEVLPEPTPENMAAGHDALLKVATANGGNALLKVEEISSEGTMTLHTQRGDLQLTSKSVHVLPEQIRADMQVMGMTMVQVLNGESGWMSQGSQVRDLPAAMMKEAVTDYYLANGCTLLLQRVMKGKIDAQMIGEATFRGTPAQDILVTIAGKKVRLYISKDGDTLLGYSAKKLGRSGYEKEETVFENWQAVSGIKLPAKKTTYSGDKKAAEETLSGYKVNEKIDPKIFDKPEAKKESK